MKNFFQNKINFINKIKFNYIFLFINLTITLLTIVYCYLILAKGIDYADFDNNIKIKNLQFWYGPVTNNLINNNELVMKQHGIDFYASRSPLIPIYIYFVYKFISTNFYIIYILKNIFFSSIIILISKKLFHKNFEIILYSILPFIVPFNALNFLQLVPAEGFLIPLFIIFFLILFSNLKFKSLILGVLIFFIFFSKSSMIYFCIIFSIIYWLINLKKNYHPIILFLFSSILWGSYTYYKTNYFAFGLNLLSINGHSMNYITNNKFNDLYPKYSLDFLHDEINEISKDTKFTNEWEVNNFYKKNAIEFIKNNKAYYLKGVVFKLKHFFFNLNKDFQAPNRYVEGEIRYSNIPNKIFFLFFLGLCVFVFIRHPSVKFKINTFLFLILIISYLLPYFIAYINTRHMSIVHILSQYYLIFYFLNYFKKFKDKNNQSN